MPPLALSQYPASPWEWAWASLLEDERTHRAKLSQLSHPSQGPRHQESQTNISRAGCYPHGRLQAQEWAHLDQLRSAELPSQPTRLRTKIKVSCCSYCSVVVVCHAALFSQEMDYYKFSAGLVFTLEEYKRKVFANTSIRSLFSPVFIVLVCSFQWLKGKKTCCEQYIRRENKLFVFNGPT